MRVPRHAALALAVVLAALIAAAGGARGQAPGIRPLGPLPPVPVPADNPMTPEKIELGTLLFFDDRLSGDVSTPCGVCHTPDQGWGDGNDISRGYPGTDHWRNAQTVLNAAYYAKLLRQITLRFQHASRGVPESVYRSADRDLGLYYTTKRPADMGKFRTPSLRELKYTAPYMHNGVFTTLEEVVDFYDRGGGDDPKKSPLVRRLGLAAQEKADLVAFLLSLSSDRPPHQMDRPDMPPYAPMVQEVKR